MMCNMQSFQACLAALRGSSDAWLAPQGAPIHGVGHSNGALLHLLIASIHRVPNRSNVIISFNNKYSFCNLLLAAMHLEILCIAVPITIASATRELDLLQTCMSLTSSCCAHARPTHKTQSDCVLPGAIYIGPKLHVPSQKQMV